MFHGSIVVALVAALSSTTTATPINNTLAIRDAYPNRNSNVPFCLYKPTLCVDTHFQNCQTPSVSLNSCYNLPSSLNNKVSSLKIGSPLKCDFFDLPNCKRGGPEKDFDSLYWIGGSDADLRADWWPYPRAWNDRISSIRCVVDTNKLKIAPGNCRIA